MTGGLQAVMRNLDILYMFYHPQYLFHSVTFRNCDKLFHCDLVKCTSALQDKLQDRQETVGDRLQTVLVHQHWKVGVWLHKHTVSLKAFSGTTQ